MPDSLRDKDPVPESQPSHQDPVVFMLWGRNARNKASMIDRNKHLVLECAHPSPLSAYHGFFGCRHFSQANAFLVQHGKEPIHWQIENL